jgi:sec-independent protein translocase protein TatB
MLDFSWSHILIVLIVALVVVGPKDLPRLMRMAGQWAGQARRMINQLRKYFGDMARESELDELRKEIGSLRNALPTANAGTRVNQNVQPNSSSAMPVAQTETTPAPGDARVKARDDALKPFSP